MEQTKDYNFFYINEKESQPVKILITASLGEGIYSLEEINEQIEKINVKNNHGKVSLYQDDGENFWKVSTTETEKLDIGSKEDNFAKWNEIKEKTLPIAIEDILVFCDSKELKLKTLKMK